MNLTTTKLLPETKRLAKQQAAARCMFLYEYLDVLVRGDILERTVIKEPDIQQSQNDEIRRLSRQP